MSKMQRDKGARAEREAAEMFRDSGLFPHAARRASGEESQSDQGVDLKHTGIFQVQVKHSQRETAWTALNEATNACHHPKSIPVAMIRKNRLPFVVILRPSDFFVLVARAQLNLVESEHGHDPDR